MQSQLDMAVECWKQYDKYRPNCENNVARMMLVWGRNKYHVAQGNACHAALNYPQLYLDRGTWDSIPLNEGSVDSLKDCKYVLSGIQRRSARGTYVKSFPHVPRDMALKFLDYLINVSPFKTTILSSDPVQVLDDRVIVSYADAPSNALVGGLIASRSLWEFHMVVYIWNALVEYGVPPNIAYPIAKCSSGFTTDLKPGHKRTSMYLPNNCKKSDRMHIDVELCAFDYKGHYPFQPGMFTIKSLYNYCNGDFVNLNPPYNKNGIYYGTSKLFRHVDKHEPNTINGVGVDDGTPNMRQFVKKHMPAPPRKTKKRYGIFPQVEEYIEGREQERLGMTRNNNLRSLTVAARQFAQSVLPKLQAEMEKIDG